MLRASHRPRLLGGPVCNRRTLPLVLTVLGQIGAAKTKAKEAGDKARKGGAAFALLGALSLLIGAFIAAVAAALGGKQRDEDEGR